MHINSDVVIDATQIAQISLAIALLVLVLLLVPYVLRAVRTLRLRNAVRNVQRAARDRDSAARAALPPDHPNARTAQRDDDHDYSPVLRVINADPRRLVYKGAACRLVDAPPGLFLFADTVGLKTQYANEIYIADNGDAFWGGTTKPAERADLLVQPVELVDDQQTSASQIRLIARVREVRGMSGVDHLVQSIAAAIQRYRSDQSAQTIADALTPPVPERDIVAVVNFAQIDQLISDHAMSSRLFAGLVFRTRGNASDPDRNLMMHGAYIVGRAWGSGSYVRVMTFAELRARDAAERAATHGE